jgi:ABC-type Mn2+/Zn2+ transport system permease subunit
MRTDLDSVPIAMATLVDPFTTPYMQRALLAVVLLGIAGGLFGAWIALRRLAFFTHAVGTATFPGLVVAGPAGIAAPIAALGAALVYTAGLARLLRGGRLGADAATGLLLVAALAAGSILAGDVFRAGAGVDRLLFGTLLGLSDTDLWLAAAVAVLAVACTALAGRTWLATGFDPAGARALGVHAATGDWLLLAMLALAVVAALPAVGALLVSTLLVVPSATARLLAGSMRGLLGGGVALALAEGVGGLWLADALDVPPGPAIAVLGGVVFAAVALGAAR